MLSKSTLQWGLSLAAEDIHKIAGNNHSSPRFNGASALRLRISEKASLYADVYAASMGPQPCG